MSDWWEYFRGNDDEELRYQAFKDRIYAEEEGRTLEDELKAADERKELEELGKKEIEEERTKYYREQYRKKYKK